jgi:hypothetical protein
MRTTYLFLLSFLMVFSLETQSQIVSGKQKSSTKTVSEAKSPLKNAKRGGRSVRPRGIQEKKVNLGFGLGASIPSMDFKAEEHALPGGTAHLYLHFLMGKFPKVGLGIYSNAYYSGVNKTKFDSRFKHLQASKTEAWLIQSNMISGLFNFTIKERISAQFMTNAGVALVNTPKNSTNYLDTLLISEIGFTPMEFDFHYDNKMDLGLSAGFAFQFVYALTSSTEFKTGFEWQYIRVKYNKNWTLPEVKSEAIVRQFNLINLQAGFAFSF